MTTRRDFIEGSLAAGLFAGLGLGAASAQDEAAPAPRALEGSAATPLVTPNNESAPTRMKDSVRCFHLIPGPVQHEFTAGLQGACWGYNGRVHGPTLEAFEGETVRIFVTNRLPVPTSVHWHGLHIPCGQDGVAGLTQRPIEPGETFVYEYTLRQHGTFLYHSHFDEMTQMAMGLMGLFIIHPKDPPKIRMDRDYALLLSEWSLRPGTSRPDPNEMQDFNLLTINGKVFPSTAPLLARLGDRVRIRIGNLSAMSHHPIHVHGHSFKVTATDGGPIAESAQWPESTVLVPVGTTRTIEFIASAPGDWALHCHMTHHTMTQMGHNLPNLIGTDPSIFDQALARVVPQMRRMGRGSHSSSAAAVRTTPENTRAMIGVRGPHGTIAMGGMFGVLKVRGPEQSFDEDYPMPPGSQVRAAGPEELRELGL